MCVRVYEHVCYNPSLLIEARWCVETVNVFPWTSVVGRVRTDWVALTTLHALSCCAFSTVKQ